MFFLHFNFALNQLKLISIFYFPFCNQGAESGGGSGGGVFIEANHLAGHGTLSANGGAGTGNAGGGAGGRIRLELEQA